MSQHVCDRCGHCATDRLERGGDERVLRHTRRVTDDTSTTAHVLLWLCGTCSVQLDAFLAGPGTIERRPVPVPVDQVAPDYSCGPCKRGEHDRCQRRVVLPDWSHDCRCAEVVKHRRTATVLVTVLD